MNVGQQVMLSRSEIARLADGLGPVVKRYKNRVEAAKALGISTDMIQRVLRRSAAMKISRPNLDKIGHIVGVDTSRMGA